MDQLERLDLAETIDRLQEENRQLRDALATNECGRLLLQQEEEFSRLLTVSKRIVSELDVAKVFDLVSDHARQIVSADLVLVPMLNETRDQYAYMAASGVDADLVRGTSHNVSVGMCGWVLQYKRSLLFGETSPHWLEEKASWEVGQQSALLVPLFGREGIIGGLSALGKQGGGAFTRHDLDLLTMFANQVSAAIENAILFQQVQREIKERKLATLALAEEKERLAVTMRSIGDGVITTDTQGRIVIINKVAEHLTGWRSAEAVGRPLSEVFHIIHEETRQPCENPVGKVMASGGIIGLANHTALIAKDGLERSIADSGAPIRDNESRIVGVVLVFRDVTDQLRREQELIKVKKLESIGVLAGGIAHDFNNILAAILGNISLSLLDSDLTVGTKTLLVEAEKASLRARDLTQQLLTFAKGGEPIRQTASLAEVVRDSADFVLRGDRVACRYIFPDDLWLVNIDKGQISQVVQNIVLNASHAMHSAGIVEIACENVSSPNTIDKILPRETKYVKMSIKDNGIGIPANIIDKIFDPYFTTKQQGSGLGMAITHSIVRKHGGHIAVESIPGVGTTFTVYLPASVEYSSPEKEAQKAPLAVRKAKILIMDDDEHVRNITQAMLCQMGNEVVLVKEGKEAVRIYKECIDSGDPIDLTIMDLTIPGGMGGKAAVKEVIRIDPQAKVVVSSGYSTDPVMSSFKEYGFCGALVKPFQMKDLVNILSTFLSESENQKEI